MAHKSCTLQYKRTRHIKTVGERCQTLPTCQNVGKIDEETTAARRGGLLKKVFVCIVIIRESDVNLDLGQPFMQQWCRL